MDTLTITTNLGCPTGRLVAIFCPKKIQNLNKYSIYKQRYYSITFINTHTFTTNYTFFRPTPSPWDPRHRMALGISNVDDQHDTCSGATLGSNQPLQVWRFRTWKPPFLGKLLVLGSVAPLINRPLNSQLPTSINFRNSGDIFSWRVDFHAKKL